MDYGTIGGQAQMEIAKSCGVPQRENELEQLRGEQRRLEARLEEVKLGQEILLKYPELLELLKILGGRRF